MPAFRHVTEWLSLMEVSRRILNMAVLGVDALRRLTKIPQETEKETESIRARFAYPETRMFPAAVTILAHPKDEEWLTVETSATQARQVIPDDLLELIQQRDGAAKLLRALPQRFSCEQVAQSVFVPGPASAHSVWETCGSVYLNSGLPRIRRHI